jgi:hypothetical protein
MSTEQIYQERLRVIKEALQELERNHRIPMTDRAIAILFAIMLQESDGIHRRQIPRGPARGLWQFEYAAVKEVLIDSLHTRQRAQAVCRNYFKGTALEDAWEIMHNMDRVRLIMKLFEKEEYDFLAVIFARLLMTRDRTPLPEPTPENEQEAWEHYIHHWAPGHPRRERWSRCWAEAIGIIKD